MNKKMAAILLPAFLTAQNFPAQAQAQTDTQYEFNARLGGSGTVPVDCDLLGPGGALTSQFVLQLDPGRHFASPAQRAQIDVQVRIKNGFSSSAAIPENLRLNETLAHMHLHGIGEEKIQSVAAYCAQHYAR